MFNAFLIKIDMTKTTHLQMHETTDMATVNVKIVVTEY